MEFVVVLMVIFLDELIFGFDVMLVSFIMCIFKVIVRFGIFVIVIIYQLRMEIFEMLDDLILFVNGQQFYEGLELGVQFFFEKFGYIFLKYVNYGDVVMDIIIGNGRVYKMFGDILKDVLIVNWVVCWKEIQSLVVFMMEVLWFGSFESGLLIVGDDDNEWRNICVLVVRFVLFFIVNLVIVKLKFC